MKINLDHTPIIAKVAVLVVVVPVVVYPCDPNLPTTPVWDLTSTYYYAITYGT